MVLACGNHRFQPRLKVRRPPFERLQVPPPRFLPRFKVRRPPFERLQVPPPRFLPRFKVCRPPLKGLLLCPLCPRFKVRRPPFKRLQVPPPLKRLPQVPPPPPRFRVPLCRFPAIYTKALEIPNAVGKGTFLPIRQQPSLRLE
jgi:hypothetical protein